MRVRALFQAGFKSWPGLTVSQRMGGRTLQQIAAPMRPHLSIDQFWSVGSVAASGEKNVHV